MAVAPVAKLDENPAPKHFWPYVWVGLSILAGLLLFGLARYYLHDEPPPDDSDLIVRGPMVLDAENGFFQLRFVPDKLLDFDAFATGRRVDNLLIFQIQNGVARDDTLVNEFLSQAQPSISQIETALALPGFAFTGNVGLSARMPEISAIVGLLRSTKLTVNQDQLTVSHHAAVQYDLLLRKFVSRLSEGYLPLVLFSASCEANSTANALSAALLNDPALPIPAQMELAHSLDHPVQWIATLQRSVNMDYLWFVSVMDAWSRSKMTLTGGPTDIPRETGEAIAKFALQKNATRKEAANYYRLARDSLRTPYISINFSAMKGVISTLTHPGGTTFQIFTKPNLGGRYLMSAYTPDYDVFIERAFTQMAADRLIQTGLALRRYYDEHHASAPTLAELVPQYLPAVPLDPFDDKPLRYDVTKGLVYSVGTDLADHGGSK